MPRTRSRRSFCFSRSVIDALTAADVAKTGHHAAVTAQGAAKGQVGPIVLVYAQYLRMLYGDAPEALGDYGLPPHKAPAPLTAVQLAARAAKAKATREARGTKGPKAKAAIREPSRHREHPARDRRDACEDRLTRAAVSPGPRATGPGVNGVGDDW